MPTYRLKILVELTELVRDDASARLRSLAILKDLGLERQALGNGWGMGTLPVAITLVCEDSKDGNNLLRQQTAGLTPLDQSV